MIKEVSHKLENAQTLDLTRLPCSQMLHKFLHSIYYPDQLSGRPFAADAIISNPPSFAHEHIAEMAGLPLMISFSKLIE